MVAPEKAAAVYVSPSTLVGWSKNPRKNAEAVAGVVESIRRFGFGAPIVARRADNGVIAGHTRLAAAKKLGLTEVPVRFLDVSEDEAHALALADNKLGERAEWDAAMLADVLGELRAAEIKIEGLGWTDKELDEMLDGVSSEGDASGCDGETYAESYQLLVVCTDEQQQSDLLQRLHSEGFQVRSLIA